MIAQFGRYLRKRAVVKVVIGGFVEVRSSIRFVGCPMFEGFVGMFNMFRMFLQYVIRVGSGTGVNLIAPWASGFVGIHRGDSGCWLFVKPSRCLFGDCVPQSL